MCSLPNIPARELKELLLRKKDQMKKAEVEKLKIIIPDYPLIESSI